MKHSTIEPHTRTSRQAAKSGQETIAGTVHGEPSKMTVYGPAGQETAGAALTAWNLIAGAIVLLATLALTFLNDIQAADMDQQAIENVIEALTTPAPDAPAGE